MIEEFTVIFECCVCHRGMIQQGAIPAPFVFNPFNGLEYCPDHRPRPTITHVLNGGSTN